MNGHADQEVLQTKTETMEKVQQDTDRINTALGKAQEQERTKQRLKVDEGRLSAARETVAKLSTAAQAEADREPEAEHLSREAALLQNSLKDYDEVAAMKSQLTIEAKAFDAAVAQSEKLFADSQAMEAELTQLKEEKTNLDNSRFDAAALDNKITEAERKATELNKLQTVLRESESLEKEYESKQRQYTAARADFEEADRRHNGMYAAFMDAQAGLLAGTLAEGQPCVGFWVLFYDFSYDLIALDEYKNHKNRAGCITSFPQLIQKFGNAVGLQTIGIILSAVGYDASKTVQSAGTVVGIENISTIYFAICLAVSLICILTYPVNRKVYAKLQAANERRRNGEYDFVDPDVDHVL